MDINIEAYLSRFKVMENSINVSQEEFMSAIHRGLCPNCRRKIYWTRDKRMGFCKSKLKDKFVITRKAYSRLGGQ